jgi:hypothetical protein
LDLLISYKIFYIWALRFLILILIPMVSKNYKNKRFSQKPGMTLDDILQRSNDSSKLQDFVQKIKSYVKNAGYAAVTLSAWMVAAVTLITLTGCSVGGKPRPRIGASPIPGSRFSNPYHLGKHSYFFNLFEQDGIVYTCEGGDIDLSHVRCNADHTRYLVRMVKETLTKGREGFSFETTWDISKDFVRFKYPEYWADLPLGEKERIAEEISFKTGAYLAYNSSIWHEICTWFGTHYVGFEPEFNSAFSWEDMYSNILGVWLGLRAIKDDKHDYDEAMTIAIDEALKELKVQPKKTAIYASKKMQGQWYNGFIFLDIIKRDTEIGLDGLVRPVLVPGICNDAEAKPLPVPTLDTLTKYGFSMKYYIEPRIWEKDKILKVAHGKGKGKTIEPAIHYPILMDFIRKEAVEKYGFDIGVCN